MDLFRRAQEAPTLIEAEKLGGEAIALELLGAMKAAGIPKADAAINALRKSGLHRLLAKSLAAGRVGHVAVRLELDRLMKELATRAITAQELKLGILAFDEACQRLAIAAGKGGPFRYSTTENRARDSMITFARSLHR
jgi:hypothetical protein